ncbi:hypothetical protein S40293_05375 [Stachybotrys chartarum IBT 40293]|nr:hypothetical protein S40293_05375 [Stachybotrys chartarum IBT 40293]
MNITTRPSPTPPVGDENEEHLDPTLSTMNPCAATFEPHMALELRQSAGFLEADVEIQDHQRPGKISQDSDQNSWGGPLAEVKIPGGHRMPESRSTHELSRNRVEPPVPKPQGMLLGFDSYGVFHTTCRTYEGHHHVPERSLSRRQRKALIRPNSVRQRSTLSLSKAYVHLRPPHYESRSNSSRSHSVVEEEHVSRDRSSLSVSSTDIEKAHAHSYPRGRSLHTSRGVTEENKILQPTPRRAPVGMPKTRVSSRTTPNPLAHLSSDEPKRLGSTDILPSYFAAGYAHPDTYGVPLFPVSPMYPLSPALHMPSVPYMYSPLPQLAAINPYLHPLYPSPETFMQHHSQPPNRYVEVLERQAGARERWSSKEEKSPVPSLADSFTTVEGTSFNGRDHTPPYSEGDGVEVTSHKRPRFGYTVWSDQGESAAPLSPAANLVPKLLMGKNSMQGLPEYELPSPRSESPFAYHRESQRPCVLEQQKARQPHEERTGAAFNHEAHAFDKISVSSLDTRCKLWDNESKSPEGLCHLREPPTNAPTGPAAHRQSANQIFDEPHGSNPPKPAEKGLWSQSKRWMSQETTERKAFQRLMANLHYIGTDKSPFLPEDPVELAILRVEVAEAQKRQLIREVSRRLDELEARNRNTDAPPLRKLLNGKTFQDTLSVLLIADNCFNAAHSHTQDPGNGWPSLAELKAQGERRPANSCRQLPLPRLTSDAPSVNTTPRALLISEDSTHEAIRRINRRLLISPIPCSLRAPPGLEANPTLHEVSGHLRALLHGIDHDDDAE